MEKKLNYLFCKKILDLYLVRHPEVENHDKNVFNGSIDVDLSEKGYQQAEELFNYFKDRDIRFVFSSPMKRCMVLASRFEGLCKVVVDERLKERRFGIFESLSWSEIEKVYQKEAKEFLNEPFFYRPNGGESFYDVERRVNGFIDDVIKRLKGNALVVAHGGVNRVIIMRLLGMKRENVLRISQDYACINHFQTDGDFFLVRLLNGKVCNET